MKLAIDKSTLEGIGDAIRMKKGTSDLIAVPNLAEEILTIPSGGGELPDWIVMGEFTPQQNLLEYSVSNPKGKLPLAVFLYAEVFFNSKAYMHKITMGFMDSTSTLRYVGAYNNNNGALGAPNLTYAYIKEYTAESIVFGTRGGQYTFPIGSTYKYFLFFEEE